MRSLIPLTVFVVLWSCGTGNDPSGKDVATTDSVPDTIAVLNSFTGYFEGTLPCADCPGIHTQLWVRSDSSFVLLRRYLERDTLAFGTMGNWTLAEGQVELYDRMQVIRRLRSSAKGVEWLDEQGLPIGSEGAQVLARVVDEPADLPRMLLKGVFTYHADAMSFRPCAMERSWPSAGGREWTAEGETLGSLGTVELQSSYLKAVKQGGDPWAVEVECSLAMGPAMEGEGLDEYLFIHRVLRTLEPGSCP